jgi:hypothetical protein
VAERQHGAFHTRQALAVGMTAPVEVIVTRRADRSNGVVIHRTRSLARSPLTTIDGIPVTRVSRTLVDLASVLDEQRLEEALDSALRQGLASVPHLRRQLATIGHNGRSGAAILGRMLVCRDGRRPSESPPELELGRMLATAGLPAAVPQYELWEDGRFLARFDWAFPEVRIAAEYNSYRHHHGRHVARAARSEREIPRGVTTRGGTTGRRREDG